MPSLRSLALALCALTADAFLPHNKRAVYPAPVEGYTTILSPSNVTIRYKEPGNDGVCETTPGVRSYSGYISVAPGMNSFFWFFESRRDPEHDPITLWLNGGPGSDSQIGLFQELGPCMIAENLTSYINPYSWSEVSNLYVILVALLYSLHHLTTFSIFLSQPYGVGFSNEGEEIGSFNNVTGSLEGASIAPPTGRYPLVDYLDYDTTELAAMAAWNIIQGFYSDLYRLDSNVHSLEFNLWTESYGGHYGPAFFDYFQERNAAIENNTVPGYLLTMNSLGIGNGIINEYIQAPFYPEFAVNNTYGIKAYNDTVYEYAKFACYMNNGCLDQITYCNQANRSTSAGQAVCTEAENECRDNVESPYYYYGGRGVYDIRHPFNDSTPYKYYLDYLNQASVQQAIGVDLNYTNANDDIYFAFQQTGDFVYPDFLADLERILNSGVRVALYYGFVLPSFLRLLYEHLLTFVRSDADYICNVGFSLTLS